MLRLLLLALVAIGLMLNTPADAAERVARTGASAQGYSFSTDLTEPTIYAYPSGQATPGTSIAGRFPPQSTLTVTVTDASGQPAAGVPVVFEVPQDSMLQGMLDIEPQQVTTGSDGRVQATIKPATGATVGTGDILVRVADATQTVGITVRQSEVRSQR